MFVSYDPYRTVDRARGEIEDRSAEAVVAVDAPLERHKLLDVTKHGGAMLYAEIVCASAHPLHLSRVCSCTVIAQRFGIANMKFEFAVQITITPACACCSCG